MDRGEDVVRQLYGRWRGPLHGYVLRMVGGDHQQAEDVVQETLLRAWRHVDELTPADAGPWLYTVARNLVISGFRKRGGRNSEDPGAPRRGVHREIDGRRCAQSPDRDRAGRLPTTADCPDRRC